MQLTSPGKLVAIVLVIVGCFAYIVASTVTDYGADVTPAWATISLITGYLIGNGTGARRGVPQQPVWSPAPGSNSGGDV